MQSVLKPNHLIGEGKSPFTVVEAVILAVLSMTVVGMWRKLLEDALKEAFHGREVLAASIMTVLLMGMVILFKNVDVGRTSVYELTSGAHA